MLRHCTALREECNVQHHFIAMQYVRDYKLSIIVT